MLQRVVVTGMGCLTPLGLTVSDTWSHLLAGQSGISHLSLTSFPQQQNLDKAGADKSSEVDALPVRIAGNLKGFDPLIWLEAKEARHFDPFIQVGVAASYEALQSAGLLSDASNRHSGAISHVTDFSRVGVLLGSGIGGLSFIESQIKVLASRGVHKISPFFIPGSIGNMAAGYISMRYGLKGPSFGVTSACATGSHNIGLAYKSIQYGEADIMLAGGVEMASCHIGMAGFCALRALSSRHTEPEKASRPWDKQRDGFVLADGAGVLVLESLPHALSRGAPILAEVVGFGMSSDAYHLTAPNPEGEGAALAMSHALSGASIAPTEVDYINAHGTSTVLGDVVETRAIKSVFGQHAYQLPVSSTKSMTGHMLGAAGAVEAIFSVLALRDQVIPPTINLDEPDSECDLDYVPHQSRKAVLQTVLSNSFGFGGTNATLLFKKWV